MSIIDRMLRNREPIAIGMALLLGIGITGCATVPDIMPAQRIDIFVLDISLSNSKEDQLSRIKDELEKSLTGNTLGVPKPAKGESAVGPSSTIFTFIVDVAPRAPKFTLQKADDVIALWNSAFAKDTERNLESWDMISSIYKSYAKSSLDDYRNFNLSTCTMSIDKELKPKFYGEQTRQEIVRTLCGKLKFLTESYSAMMDYVISANSPATDIYGSLNQLDRLTTELLANEPASVISVNISSDMQHETGDARDLPPRLESIHLVPTASCELGKADRLKDTITFDAKTSLHINGIANATSKNFSAEKANSIIHYWQCYFSSNTDIR